METRIDVICKTVSSALKESLASHFSAHKMFLDMSLDTKFTAHEASLGHLFRDFVETDFSEKLDTHQSAITEHFDDVLEMLKTSLSDSIQTLKTSLNDSLANKLAHHDTAMIDAAQERITAKHFDGSFDTLKTSLKTSFITKLACDETAITELVNEAVSGAHREQGVLEAKYEALETRHNECTAERDRLYSLLEASQSRERSLESALDSAWQSEFQEALTKLNAMRSLLISRCHCRRETDDLDPPSL